MTGKMWGKKEFWGIGPEFDLEWNLDPAQIALRDNLIQLCKQKIRPNAVKSDKTYEFPKESLKVMHEKLGLMGLIIPKELGGLGQSHVCLGMVVETLARYGCPSTAMIYAMHNQSIAMLLYRYHESKEISNLLRRVSTEGLIGTTAYSDAATGGHFWFPLSAKAKKIDEDFYKAFKFNSWSTGAGFVDYYIFQTPTPEAENNYSDLTTFFVFKDEIRASTDNWSALGLHGNQSGPSVFEGILHKSRMIGKPGEGQKINDEVAATFFLICTSAVWNGIAMGAIDIVKKHTTLKSHGDTGQTIAEYPIIQDYVGKSLMATNCCRGFFLTLLSQLDVITNKNEWHLHKNPDFNPRSSYLLWLMQSKYNCSENVSGVTDQMMKACGGDGFKTELGLERLLRDSKAGCVMAPTNEVIKNMIGKGSLLGLSSLDMWSQRYCEKTIHNQIKKMNMNEKMDLIASLSEEVERERQLTQSKDSPQQDNDFDNPFNTSPPKYVEEFKTNDGIEHSPALKQNEWKKLKLTSLNDVSDTMTLYTFAFPEPTDHSGCLTGQYIQVRVPFEGKYHERYFSPTSPPNQFGQIEILLKHETHGIVSNVFKNLKIASEDMVEFRGPCGGFEYEPNKLDEITIIASGSGVTPGLQVVQSISMNDEDTTKATILFYAKDVQEATCVKQIETIAEKDPRIQVITTLGETPEEWDKEEGFVTINLLDRHVTKPNGLKHKILMCGGPTMTISCLHSLRTLKFPSEMIFIYGQFGTGQIRAVYGRNAKLSTHQCFT